MAEFTYQPAAFVPFRDVEVLARMRRITREEIARHPNPDFQIRVMKAEDIGMLFITDMFYRIKESDDEDRPVVMILPNPVPDYRHVAMMINRFRVNCRNVHLFAMDEYANEEGSIAPESWRFGFMHAMQEHFVRRINPALRMPASQVHGPSNANINRYGQMIADMGGADICYSGPGWTGHLAFIEPDAPEFDADLETWMRMGPRVCTLSPFTIAQNSLHGSFGMSGDLAIVPPKAATIGPAEVVAAKHRLDFCSITVHGTSTSWQRMVARLVTHGPVTPRIPTSIHQLLRTDCYISEENAASIKPDRDKGY